MIIAQGAANDDPRVYMHAAMHENPADQSYSKDPFTTREKEDADDITVPFAYIGKSLYVIPQIRNRPHKMTQRSKR